MSVSVTVNSAGRPPKSAKALPVSLSFAGKSVETITIGDVKAALQAKFPRFSVHRQKLSTEGSKVPLGDEKTLSQLDLPKASEIVFSVKDLGPQVSWQTVFFTEYAGPLIIHPLIYYFPKVFFRRDFQHSELQKFVYFMVMGHFLKREFETAFIHRFSHATMPLRNIFKNSAHYHILSGVLLAGGIYGPWYSAPALKGTLRSDPVWLWGWATVFILSEFLNLQSHITLRNLRPPGTKTRGIPRGGLFEYVSCPNYFSETLAWIAVTGLTLSAPALLFTVVSAGQMVLWAIKKHKAYKKDFGNAYPRRKVMFPFIF